MGRPRKDKEKSPNLNIRTESPEEHAAFYAAAKKAGLKLPALIRLRILGKKPRQEDKVPTPQEEIQLQSKVALQQIAANTAGILRSTRAGETVPDNIPQLILLELRFISNKLDTLHKPEPDHDL